MNDTLFLELLAHLPPAQQEEILSQRFLNDRSHKLIGKLLVEQLHATLGYPFAWTHLKRDAQNKPFVEGGLHFNISHSGQYIAVAATEKGSVGIDIEENNAHLELSRNFHEDEQNFIRSSSKQNDAFMYVWTRKEAYLKAKGIGITNGLNNESCLPDVIQSDDTWHIQSIEPIENYHWAVCSKFQSGAPVINELTLNEIQERYNTVL